VLEGNAWHDNDQNELQRNDLNSIVLIVALGRSIVLSCTFNCEIVGGEVAQLYPGIGQRGRNESNENAFWSNNAAFSLMWLLGLWSSYL
jgi:hypothetical protein